MPQNENAAIKHGKLNPLVRCGNCRHWHPTGDVLKFTKITHRLGNCKREEDWESTGDCERCENFDGGTEDV